MNQPTKVTPDKSIFLEKHSAAIRIWHWMLFICISFIIITVVFNTFIFDKSENVAMVKQVLKDRGIELSFDQARAVAHEYGEKLWVLHKYLGYTLSLLFLARIIIEISLSKEEKSITKINKATALLSQKLPNKNFTSYYIMVRYSYVVFYVLMFYMAVTGLITAFSNELGFSRQNHHLIKEMHGFGQYLIYTYILIHLVGVIVADIKHSKGIVSGMINGGK